MNRKLLWALLGAVVVGLVAAIVIIQLSGGVGAVREVGRSTAVDAPAAMPEPKAASAPQRTRATASNVRPASEGPGYGAVVLIALGMAVVGTLLSAWYSRRQFAGKLEQLESEMADLKRRQSNQDNRINSLAMLQPQQAGTGQPARPAGMIPPSIPTPGGQGYGTPPAAAVPPYGYSAPNQPPASYAPPADVYAPPPVDPAEEARRQAAAAAQAASRAAADFQHALTSFLDGSSVSQKAFDAFVARHGRAIPVNSVEGSAVHLATDPTGNEKLLALQLHGHDVWILMPTFYFISDFNGSFAKSRDIPREIRAAFETVFDGSGLLRINRLGRLQQLGGHWQLAEPRGELGGFIG